MNFALLDGTAYYHSVVDTVDNFDSASLQHQGDNMLALVRGFGERDLSDIYSASDVTFCTLFGFVVSYSAALVWPIAAPCPTAPRPPGSELLRCSRWRHLS